MIMGCPLWPDCGCGTQSGPHTCEYQVELREQYKKYGIDPLNPNPDGSDYHIMDVIEADLNAKYRRNK